MTSCHIYVCVKIKKQFVRRGLERRSLGIEISYVGLYFLDLFLVPQEKLSHMINLGLLFGNHHSPSREI